MYKMQKYLQLINDLFTLEIQKKIQIPICDKQLEFGF